MTADRLKVLGVLRLIPKHLTVDHWLLGGTLALLFYGLVLLYSAGNQNFHLIEHQLVHMLMGLTLMFALAQVPPHVYYKWTPYIFGFGITLLLSVLLIGVIGKGAQRWLNLGLLRFQPSEIMKLATPMMLAWYLHDRALPPSNKTLFICILLMIVPAFLVAKEPDLGTAIVITGTGGFVLLLAGLPVRVIIKTGLATLAGLPILWHFMHDYQKQRVLTFLNPERTPLGSGYHIIQSKIAIGSGGLMGKGWLEGTQSHLQFLPEHTTDFIFAVCGEEFGLIGCIFLVAMILLISLRGLYISAQAQTTYTRLLGGSLALTFFISAFTNIGMVTGILPVVGLPLPLVSYGGSTMLVTMANLGILMSIRCHRRLLSS